MFKCTAPSFPNTAVVVSETTEELPTEVTSEVTNGGTDPDSGQDTLAIITGAVCGFIILLLVTVVGLLIFVLCTRNRTRYVITSATIPLPVTCLYLHVHTCMWECLWYLISDCVNVQNDTVLILMSVFNHCLQCTILFVQSCGPQLSKFSRHSHLVRSTAC